MLQPALYASASRIGKHCDPGLLQPLEPPTTRFTHYTMDFVFGLPQSEGHDGIMTIVDCATKRVVLIPVSESITAP